MEHRAKPNNNKFKTEVDPFDKAQEAFKTLRGLASGGASRGHIGAEMDRALVGPAYLGNVALGLRGKPLGLSEP